MRLNIFLCMVITALCFLGVNLIQQRNYYKDIRIRTEFALQCVLELHDHIDEASAKRCFSKYMNKDFNYDD